MMGGYGDGVFTAVGRFVFFTTELKDGNAYPDLYLLEPVLYSLSIATDAISLP